MWQEKYIAYLTCYRIIRAINLEDSHLRDMGAHGGGGSMRHVYNITAANLKRRQNWVDLCANKRIVRISLGS
jgi:hypothetical protein